MTKGHKENANLNKCLKCSKSFKLKKSLECHREICHGLMLPIIEESQCNKCDKIFDTDILLNEHMASHQVFDEMIKRSPNSKKQKIEVTEIINGENKRKFENSKSNTDSISPPRKIRNERFCPENDTFELEDMDTVPDERNTHALVNEMKNLDIKPNETTVKNVNTNTFEDKLKKKIEHTMMLKLKKKEAYEERIREQEQEREEMKKRSAFMDKKVQEVERKKNIEEVEENEKKKKENDLEVAKENEAKKIRKATMKRIKKHQKKKMDMQVKGYTEIDPKYHHLVGKYRYQYHGVGDGACQSRAESKILFGNQHKGLEYAKVKNQYLIDHFSSFEEHIKFPHSIKVGSGKYEKFHNFEQFKNYLQNNPNSKLMWGDHVQLQITANLFNLTTHLLVANGDGNVLTFNPDARLKKFAIEELESKDEIWLIYINNNHYDALVADDSTCVTMNNDILQVEIETDEEDYEYTEAIKTHRESNNKDIEIVKPTVEALPLLGKWIAGPPNQAPQPRVEVYNKFEVKTETTEDKLKKEIKEHNVTKHKLKAIEDGYKECKVELRNVQEDKERLKIKLKDLESIEELTDIKMNESIKRREKDEIFKCVICEYPFKDQVTLKKHTAKHKKKHSEIEVKQCCGICETTILSNNELKRHIKIKHSEQFTCNQCDFQASTKMILTKHINIKHRTGEDQLDGTLRCKECGEQFSTAWSMGNHMRDNHTKKTLCKFFKDGRCKFTETQCWNIHVIDEERNLLIVKDVEKKTKCFNCDQAFKTMKNMMDHRSKNHTEKI